MTVKPDSSFGAIDFYRLLHFTHHCCISYFLLCVNILLAAVYVCVFIRYLYLAPIHTTVV